MTYVIKIKKRFNLQVFWFQNLGQFIALVLPQGQKTYFFRKICQLGPWNPSLGCRCEKFTFLSSRLRPNFRILLLNLRTSYDQGERLSELKK